MSDEREEFDPEKKPWVTFGMGLVFLLLLVGATRYLAYAEWVRPVAAAFAHFGLDVLAVLAAIALVFPVTESAWPDQERTWLSAGAALFCALIAGTAAFLLLQPVGEWLVGGAHEQYVALHDQHATAAVEADSYEATERHSELAKHYQGKEFLYRKAKFFGAVVWGPCILLVLAYGSALLELAVKTIASVRTKTGTEA